MKEPSKYDLVVKDLFQRDHPSLLDRLTGGVPVREVLGGELARLEERRADLVLLLADGSIFHIEFQTANDRDMPYRMGIYCLLIGQKHRRRVRQVVLYLGHPAMRMDSRVDLGETRSAYTLMDIRDVDARTLLSTGRAGDLALAMLANGGKEQLLEIAQRAARLDGAARRRVLSQLVLLSGLGSLEGKIRMELKGMDATRDITKNVIIQDIIRDDRAQLFRKQLRWKFGAVPKWVDERLEEATSAKIERWTKKILTAETLEGVVGKR